MDPFTRLNGAVFRATGLSAHIFAQRAYMKVWKVANPVRTFQTSFGSRMRANIVDYIPGRICFFGIWEPSLTRFMSETVKPGDTVVDVGANIGYFTLLLSSLVGPTGRVISIEASPQTAAMLRANVELNGCKNVDVREIAVTEQPGTLKLFHSKFGDGNTGMATVVEGRGSTSFDLVKTDTLLSILGADAGRVSFIKIDIEGAELPVLKEIAANRNRFAPAMTVVSEVDDSNMAIADSFRAIGFKVAYIENDYSLRSYLEQQTHPLKAFNGTKPETADMVFTF
jgi:FkbM family methyltransferase